MATNRVCGNSSEWMSKRFEQCDFCDLSNHIVREKRCGVCRI
jgi:hypothetical protein